MDERTERRKARRGQEQQPETRPKLQPETKRCTTSVNFSRNRGRTASTQTDLATQTRRGKRGSNTSRFCRKTQVLRQNKTQTEKLNSIFTRGGGVETRRCKTCLRLKENRWNRSERLRQHRPPRSDFFLRFSPFNQSIKQTLLVYGLSYRLVKFQVFHSWLTSS